MAAVAATALALPAFAEPVTLTGNYIKTAVSDAGTLGSNGSTSPGILHDPSGTQNFGVNDYLTPGSPHEGFWIRSGQFSSQNDNNFSSNDFTTTSGPTLLTGAAANGYANAASWSGTNRFANVTNSYFFNEGDERILITTTITALSDLTNVAFARSLDPDPDVNTFGSYDTNNQRGNAVFGVTDFVGAAGLQSGLTIGLLNLNGDALTHNTFIGTSSCCSTADPYTVLGGSTNSANGDYSINLAYSIGDLAAGSSVTLRYAYIVGNNIETVTGDVPEPATWAMMVGGFGLVGSAMRRRKTTVAFG